MRTRTGFLAVVGAFVGELTLAQPTTPHVIRGVTTCLNVPTDHGTSTTPIVCLPNGTQVDVTDSVPYWHEIVFGSAKSDRLGSKEIPATGDPAPANIPAVGLSKG